MHQDSGSVESHTTRTWIPLLGGILILAGLLRLYGIGFGLPYLYHVDEPSYILGAVRLGAGQLASVPYDPTGFINILFVEFVALFGGGWLFGWFESISDFTALYESDQTAFYMLARATSAVLGALGVVAVYAIGRRVRDEGTGLLGALFLAVSFLHVRDSHFATPDVTAAFFVVVAVMLSTIFTRTRSVLVLYLAGLTAGLAVSTKWTVLPVGLALLWAIVGSQEPSGDRPRVRVKVRWLALALVGVLSGAALGGFQIFLDPAPYWGKVLTEQGRAQQAGYEGWYVDTVPASIFYLKTLGYGIGIPLILLSIVGLGNRLIAAVHRRDLASQILLTFPLPYAIFMGTSDHFFARYALPLLPFFAILAADGLVVVRSGVERVGLNRRRATIVFGVLAVVATVPPLARSVRFDFLLQQDDTRTVANEWVEANLAPGSTIAVDWSVWAPPLDSTQPTYPWTPSSGKQYDVTAMQYGFLHEKDTSWFREQGFDYLITSSFVHNLRWVAEEDQARKQRFYEAVDRELELIREFSPYGGGEDDEPRWNNAETYGPATHLWRRERPGPTLRVYQIRYDIEQE